MDINQTSRPAGSTASPRPGTAPTGSQQSTSVGTDLRAKAGEAVSKLTDAAQQAGSQVKDSAAALASDATQKAKGLLNQQVTAGADLVGNVASSARRAADDLDRSAPQLADLVRGAAGRVEEFSNDMRGQSVEDLFRKASDFTRRQPALVFGLASLAGFFLFRVLKSGPASTTAHAFDDHHGQTYGQGPSYGQGQGSR